MPLNVVRAEDPLTIDRLILCLYGSPGLGKTTIGFSAESPLLLDFDRGAQRAARRRDSVQIETWSDVAEIRESDVEGYKTIVIDTAGRALDLLTADIIRRNPKMGRGGALTLQGYGALKAEFVAWIKSIRELNKDVVLIAHSSEDKSGDDLVERLDIQGGSKGEVYKVADAMGRLRAIPGQALPSLNFSPSETAFGKNPGSLPELQVPNVEQEPEFLAGVIQKIKDRINSLTEEQQARQTIIDEWIPRIQEASSEDGIAALIEESKSLEANVAPMIKGAIVKRARDELGLVFDKEAGKYVAQEVKKETDK